MALRAAVASVDLTPRVGVELCGYGYYLARASTGVLDPLLARALVLEAGSDRIAIVACDLLGVSRDVAHRTQALVRSLTGIPPGGLLLACSHTHSGPAAVPVRGCGEEDADYVASLPHRIAEAVCRATESLGPARIGFARGTVPGLGFNRVEGDAGPLDRELAVMAVQSPDGAPIAVVFHAVAHAVTNVSLDTLISGDWPGVASRQIGQAAGGEALYLAGASGDVNPVLAGTGRADEAGALVGECVAELLPQIEYSDEGTVAGAARDLALPLDPIAPETLRALAEEARRRMHAANTPDTVGARHAARVDLEWAEELLRASRESRTQVALATEVQALRIGPGLMLAHGGELFCEYGLALKAHFAPRPTFVVGYANDFVGYVPDPEDFARGGYAAATVPRICGYFPFTTDVGARLVAGLIEVAADVGA